MKHFLPLETFNHLLKNLGYIESKIAAVWLDISRSVVLERLKHRLICDLCGKSSNQLHNICSCGGTLKPRNDDQDINVIRTKIKWFEEDVTPVIHYMQDKNKLLSLTSSDNEVLNQIVYFIDSINQT